MMHCRLAIYVAGDVCACLPMPLWVSWCTERVQSSNSLVVVSVSN